MDEHIDFDDLQHLACNNPAAFELQRQALVDAAIAQVPEARQHRLRCLQWRIEKVCASASSPISASLRLSRMMWESIGRQQDWIQYLAHNDASPDSVRPGLQAEILTFPNKSAE